MNFNFQGGASSGLAMLGMLVVILGWIAFILVHIAFSIAVYRDADRLERAQRLWFVAPLTWWLAALIGGPMTAAVYWAMHHSQLATTTSQDSPSARPGD